MGEVDVRLERYFEDPVRYADLINGYRFQGRQVVKPEDVKEKDSRLSGKSQRKKGKQQKGREHQKQRDIVRRVIFGAGIAIIAFENQMHVHHAMPVRIFVEDALEYDKQLRMIQRNHREQKDLAEESEYLGQFSAEDRMIPAFTIVLYFGEGEWNGPRDLLDLMDLTSIPEELREMINGYPLHVLEVRKFKDIDNFQTDLRDIFGVIQSSSNEEELLAYTAAHQDSLENLQEDAYDVIASVIGNTELIVRKEEYRKEGDAMNLCKGMVEWAERERREGHAEGRSAGRLEGRMEGRMEGRVEGRREGRLETQMEIARNALKMGMEPQKVATLCGESLETIRSWSQDTKLE